jgi:hypothetical protein
LSVVVLLLLRLLLLLVTDDFGGNGGDFGRKGGEERSSIVDSVCVCPLLRRSFSSFLATNTRTTRDIAINWPPKFGGCPPNFGGWITEKFNDVMLR